MRSDHLVDWFCPSRERNGEKIDARMIAILFQLIFEIPQMSCSKDPKKVDLLMYMAVQCMITLGFMLVCYYHEVNSYLPKDVT